MRRLSAVLLLLAACGTTEVTLTERRPGDVPDSGVRADVDAATDPVIDPVAPPPDPREPGDPPCVEGEFSPSHYLGDCCAGTPAAWACWVSDYVCRDGAWEETYEHCDCFCPDAGPDASAPGPDVGVDAYVDSSTMDILYPD